MSCAVYSYEYQLWRKPTEPNCTDNVHAKLKFMKTVSFVGHVTIFDYNRISFN